MVKITHTQVLDNSLKILLEVEQHIPGCMTPVAAPFLTC